MRKALLLLLLVPVWLWGCDKVSPTAPEGSILTISASPDRIASTGTSQITVVARKASGFPVNPGTIVHLSSTRGSLPASGQTNSEGVVSAVLSANGQVGTAVVKANAGAAEEAMIEVEIGGMLAASVSLTANPTSVSVNGGRIDLLALVRGDQGQPIGGVLVNFTTQVGSLASGGDFVSTDSGGRAEDTLDVEARDIPASGASFDVTVEVPGTGGTLITRTRTITIQRGASTPAPTTQPAPTPTLTPTP